MKPEVTILFPCLNESETLGGCLVDAHEILQKNGISYELLVADNGSDDNSPEIAKSLNAKVVAVPTKGYGNALKAGIKAASGDYVIMLDSDGSYSLENISEFRSMILGGADLVMGNRFAGGIMPKAMPIHHRYFGNPVLSWLGRKLFKTKIRDFHCGIRAFKRERILSLNLSSGGMEFASELVVKAVLSKYSISEIPVKLYPDKRSGKPHLRSFRDGWRHLKFLLAYAPKSLFLIPARISIFIGLLIMVPIEIFGKLRIEHFVIESNGLILAGLSLNLGICLIAAYKIANLFSEKMNRNLIIADPVAEFGGPKSDQLLTTGFLFTTIGLLMLVGETMFWATHKFHINASLEFLRLTVPSATLILAGFQIFILGLVKMSVEAFSQD